MANYIWDTGALSLVYAGHKRASQYYREILDQKHQGMVLDLVLSEYYYKTWQKFGEQAALISTMNYENEVLDIVCHDQADIYNIGEMKVKYSLLSMVDCILITVAKKHRATILTTDHPIKNSKECKAIKLRY